MYRSLNLEKSDGPSSAIKAFSHRPSHLYHFLHARVLGPLPQRGLRSNYIVDVTEGGGIHEACLLPFSFFSRPGKITRQKPVESSFRDSDPPWSEART